MKNIIKPLTLLIVAFQTNNILATESITGTWMVTADLSGSPIGRGGNGGGTEFTD